MLNVLHINIIYDTKFQSDYKSSDCIRRLKVDEGKIIEFAKNLKILSKCKCLATFLKRRFYYCLVSADIEIENDATE